MAIRLSEGKLRRFRSRSSGWSNAVSSRRSKSVLLLVTRDTKTRRTRQFSRVERSRGSVHPKQTPSAGTDLRVDSQGGQPNVSTLNPKPSRTETIQGGHLSKTGGGCPPSEPSAGAESAQGGQPDQYPRARDGERTDAELNASKDSAWKMWD